MKSKILALSTLISASLCLSSCSLFFTTVDVETNLDTDVKVIDTIDTTDDTVDTTDITANNIADILPENLAAVPGADELILGDDIEYCDLYDWNAVVVYNNKNAWIFDLTLNCIIPIVDYDAMLVAADTTGRGMEYFDGDLSLSLEFPYKSDTQAEIVLKVAGDDGCEYSVYTYYSKSGYLTDYRYNSMVYPGSDEPVVITDVKDYAKLGIADEVAESSYMFNIPRAIVENDIDELKNIFMRINGTLTPEAFDSWEGMEISEYSIYRMPPLTPFLDEISFIVKIEKSNVDALPPGEYLMRIYDGLGIHVEINNVNEPKIPVETEAANWIAPFVRTAGSFKPEDMVVTNDDYVHAILDSTIWYYNGDEPMDINSFAEYCEKYFGLEDVEEHYTSDFVTNHGGHGLSARLFEIREDYTASGIHKITVDFFADPMGTIIASTYEYTLVEIGNGEFRLDGAAVTYDSGYGIYGWSA